MKAIIAGGGIGGLTAALCLHRAGWQVSLIEQAVQFGDIGAGIQLSPNAMKVYRALGIAPQIARTAVRPEALELRLGRSGRTVFRAAIERNGRNRWGAPYLHIHRADLISVLSRAVRECVSADYRLDARLTGFEDTPDGVRVVLQDGTALEGDLLVGADGLHSHVRAGLLGESPARFTGHVAFRATAPMSALGEHAPDRTACVWAGPGRHAVTYQLRGGETANLVAIVETGTPEDEGWSLEADRGDVLAAFEGWHPVIGALINKAPDIHRWGLYDRAPLDTWHGARTVLLGDACHPMLPFMAQGAAMAIEDGWVLADALRGADGDLEPALAAYEARRKPRTSRVQAASTANANLFHRRSTLAQIASYGPMWLAGQLAPWAIRRRQDRFYRVDVTGGA